MFRAIAISSLLTFSLSSFLSGCSNPSSDVSTSNTEKNEADMSSQEQASAEKSERRSPITLQLAPHIENGQMQKIDLNWFGEDIWKRDDWKEQENLSKYIEWSSSPSLTEIAQGKFVRSSNSSLSFVATSSLTPSQTLEITINKIYTSPDKSAWIVPETPDLWKSSITMPDFAVSFVSLSNANYKTNKAYFSIQTNYDIDPSLLKDKLNIEIGNRLVSRYSLTKKKAGTFEITIDKIGSLFGKEINITVGAIQYPESTKKSEPYHYKSTFTHLKPIKLFGPFVKETASGFTVEYFCDDAAVSQKSWHWNSEFHFDQKISRRCAIDTNAIETALKESTDIDNLAVYPRERGFAVIGNFTKGNYTLSIPAGIGSQDGGLILEPYIQTANIPLRRSSLRFFSQGRYLPTEGWANLYYQARNINDMTISVREVRKENLHNWFANRSETVREAEGDIIYKETIALKSPVDQTLTNKIDLSEKIKERKPGIYEVVLHSETAESSLRLQVTNLNIVAKKYIDEDGNTQLRTWALHSQTNHLIPSVKISTISPAGTTTSECYTDQSGYCSLAITKDELNNPAYALYAERIGDDGQEEMSYLRFDQLAIDLGLYNTSGASGSKNQYRIAAHSDRGAYRPGDTVQLFALIRDKNDHAPKSGLPVVLKIRDGRGQQVETHTLNTNAAGVLSQTLAIPDYANTGSWSVEWSIQGAKKTILGTQSYSFRVEDLMPERMAVVTKFSEKEILGGAPLTGTIDARYLFGSPASEADFSVRCEVESHVFEPKNNKNYRFGSTDAFSNFYLGTVKGQLNEEGKAEFACPNPERLANLPGMARVIAAVDVMESGSGRSTHRQTSLKAHPAKFYIGLQIGASEIETNVQYPVSGIIVDWNGNRNKDISSIEIQSSQVDYSYQWYYDEERHEYRRESSKFEIPIQQFHPIPVKNGLFSYSITGEKRVSEYRIRAQKDNLTTLLDVPGEYYSWYYRSSETHTPDPFRPDYLEITAPKKMNLTETVSVQTTVPYPGKLLWTVERDGLIRHEWVDVTDSGDVSWSFNLAGQSYQNNVYVSALLVKDPHAEAKSAYMPSRAFGTQSIDVRIDKFTHPLKISVPSEVEANTTMKVSLDLGSNLEKDTVAMVAVVDEGLLSLTNFATPNPSSALFPKMPLSVSSYETIGWNIASPSLGDTSKAGGGADGDGRRKAKVVKPVALWSGVVDIPSSGKKEISFDIPQYTGQVRIMVVTSSPTRFASTSEKVFVKDPLTLQATLPRFLTAGDSFQVPVFLTNLSGKRQTVELSMSAIDGENSDTGMSPIRFLGKDKTTITLENEQQKVVAFQAVALQETGFAKFTVQAKAGDLLSKETAEVPFSSRKPTERSFTKLQLSQLTSGNLNGSVDLTPYLNGWLTEDTTIWATSNPYADSLVKIQDLLHYPYGCVEQTSSSLRPLLTAADILPQIDPRLLADKPINEMVQAGITRLASMQTSDGGLGYWPGATTSHPWGTAYATHVLLDARDAGHNVMPELISRSLDYLDRIALNQYNYGYYQYSMPSARPYAHYVLAREGKGKPVTIRDLLARGVTSYESEYMLKTALYLSGDRTYEQELRSLVNIGKLYNEHYDYWSFRSQMRSKGMILALHQEMFGSSDEKGEGLASELNDYLSENRNRYLSTQVVGWSTYALSKRVLSQTNWKSPTLKQNNKEVASVNTHSSGASWNLWDSDRKDDNISVKGQNSDSYLLISTTGIKKDSQYEYGDHSISISRVYLNMDGTPFDPQTHNMSDEVVVLLTATNLSNQELHELALVDRIPAGWEINNPSLGRFSDLSRYYSGTAWDTDYVSMRDKQLEIFGDIQPKSSVQYVYTVRATSAGSFFIPPVSIESMYNDRIWSRKAGSILNIQGPWTKHLL